MKCKVWLIVGLFAVCGRADAKIYSPRVLSPHNADTYSMKTFAEFRRWRALKGDAKVYEIFKYLTDRRTGIYPLGTPAWEGKETLSEFGAVRDPVKMLNVYPIGHCGTLGPTMAGIMQDMGIGKSRTLVLPGWNHVVAEVYYDRQWHYLDLDVRAVFRRDDGSLASMQQAKKEDALWKRGNSPTFFPLDPIERVRQVYAQTPISARYGLNTGGHTMDFVLRQGESFTRWWKPQGGRWNHHASYVSNEFRRKLFEQSPRGPKCKHASFTEHTHGNGRFVYAPNLTAGFSDFQDGVYASNNVRASASGLTLDQEGMGFAIFEVRSPYVIVPIVGDLETTADDREASTVEIDSDGAALSISLDNGISWREVATSVDSPTSFDLTPLVSGTYGYLLKIRLRGETDQAVVRSLRFTTWVQVHPASLPALRQGKNQMRYVAGDHFGLPTRVVEIRPQLNTKQDLLKHLVEPPTDFEPARATDRIRGSFVVKVPSPPATKIAWFSAGASFRTHQRHAAKQTRNTIDYAVDKPEKFRQIYQADVPTDQDHWHYNTDREVRLEKPASTVFIRYLGDPAVNNIRIYAHCLDDRPTRSQRLHVRHVWMEDEVQKRFEATLAEPGSFAIDVATDPINESIELWTPSKRVASP